MNMRYSVLLFLSTVFCLNAQASEKKTSDEHTVGARKITLGLIGYFAAGAGGGIGFGFARDGLCDAFNAKNRRQALRTFACRMPAPCALLSASIIVGALSLGEIGEGLAKF